VRHDLRADAEIIRDIAMAASGLLSSKMFGPPVYPPISDGDAEPGLRRADARPTATGEIGTAARCTHSGNARVPYPSMLVFDQPNGDSPARGASGRTRRYNR